MAQASDYVALDQKQDITTFPAVRAAARKAYADGGRDRRTISSSRNCTTASPSPRSSPWRTWGSWSAGEGGFFTLEGGTRRDGAMPINASGGLKSKGHPVGATGAAQICDMVQQMRCEAGERQLTRHSLGLAQNLGGSGRHLRGDAFWGAISMRTGTVYTETVVHLAPTAFAGDVPYQVAIVDTRGRRPRHGANCRANGCAIGDPVVETESRDGIPFFRKS